MALPVLVASAAEPSLQDDNISATDTTAAFVIFGRIVQSDLTGFSLL
jgi:hypothetical protein